MTKEPCLKHENLQKRGFNICSWFAFVESEVTTQPFISSLLLQLIELEPLSQDYRRAAVKLEFMRSGEGNQGTWNTIPSVIWLIVGKKRCP
uniref:Putative ovule protein n=1 Tax=Solanum chacoense TaxID=4108 RepID=A0A0V0HMT3_SOLCH